MSRFGVGMNEDSTVLVELEFNFFGPFQITSNQEPIVGISSDRVRGLLAYLALESGRAHRREVLAEIFWPGRRIGSARANLKQAISQVKKKLGDRKAELPILVVSRDEIQFNSERPHFIDVRVFKTLLASVKNHSHEDAARCEYCAIRLNQVVALYRGDFLLDTSIPDSQVFEEWALIQREALRRQQARSLRVLTTYCEAQGDLEEACRLACQLVELETWNEEHHRRLMSLYIARGMRSRAMRQYRNCERIMLDEFGVKPSQETRTVYEEINRSTSDRSKQPRPVTEKEAGTRKPTEKKSLSAWWNAKRQSLILPRRVLLGAFTFVGALALVIFGAKKILERRVISQLASESPTIPMTGGLDGITRLASGEDLPFRVGSGSHWFVSIEGDDDHDCQSPATPCATITGALWKDGFTPGDTVYVETGIYTGYGTEVLIIYQDVALSGGWNHEFTAQTSMSILDGEGQRRGLSNPSANTVIVENFKITQGSSRSGGGILNGGVLVLIRCTIENNTAEREGGGIHNQEGALLVLDKSTVSLNHALSGGSLFNGWGEVQIRNSTLSGNIADGGGGINNLGGVIDINNSTITGNKVRTMGGGGIRNEGQGTVFLKNTILAGNSGYGQDCNGILISMGHNLIGDTENCAFLATEGDLLHIEAQLDALRNNGGLTRTHALLPNSPAINAGSPDAPGTDAGACEPDDQRGVLRPMVEEETEESLCDMGAFELDTDHK